MKTQYTLLSTFLCTVILLFVVQHDSLSQTNIGIGTQTPDPYAAMEVFDNSKGMMIPRLTTAQRNAISGLGSGQEGLFV